MSEDISIKKILVPLDGSDPSFRAARYALKIAKMANADVICVHAILNLPYSGYATAGLATPEYVEELKKTAENWYDEVRRTAEKAGVRVHGDTIFDVVSATDSIINYAEKNNADLIIMGTKGRTGLKKYLLGSVATGVVTHARCPVLVVR
jgi:nucleotide-binding universal stress UspA family protein